MPTYHYVQNQGKLMLQSRENGQKPQFGQFFNDLEVKYLHIANFSEKYALFKSRVIFSVNFRPKTKKIIRTVFEKNIRVFNGLIWWPFREYLQIKNFFKTPALWLFYLSSLTSCKLSKKSLEPRFWENCITAHPPNQLLTTQIL